MKKRFLLIVLIVSFIFLLSFLFSNLSPIREVLLGMSSFSSTKKQTDVILSVKNLIMKKQKTFVGLKEENTCYWLRATRNKTHYLLEIKEYKYPPGTKGCFGFLKNTTYIILDEPVNLKGLSCLCDDDTYRLEWKNGLKVIKSGQMLW